MITNGWRANIYGLLLLLFWIAFHNFEQFRWINNAFVNKNFLHFFFFFNLLFFVRFFVSRPFRVIQYKNCNQIRFGVRYAIFILIILSYSCANGEKEKKCFSTFLLHSQIRYQDAIAFSFFHLFHLLYIWILNIIILDRANCTLFFSNHNCVRSIFQLSFGCEHVKIAQS